MSKSNGEKARAAIEKRRRTARRVSDRARKAEVQRTRGSEGTAPEGAAAVVSEK